jgi:hypothetical protein
MKTQNGSLGRATLLLIALVGSYSCLADQPVITSITTSAGTNVIVEVSVPAGFQRVTLESRTRLGDGTWSPLAVGQNDGSATTLRFSAPCTRQSELIRVRADAHQALPSAFYKGPTSFAGSASSSTGALPPGATDGSGVLNGPAGPSSGDASRSVVESDIWQIDGDRLYFFNQYRGLQVIDISNPDTAFVRGTLDLPAQGEQMYLVDTNHVVLLANGPCGYGSSQSQALVVDVSKSTPVLATNLPVEGWIQDSRMVGTALYIAAQGYRPAANTTNNLWEWGTIVTSFDLANPDQPVQRSTLWYPGYGNVVNATDTYLFVVTQDVTNWWQSLIQIIDVTSPDGTMASTSALRTAGQVADKFKLNYSNQVFTAISEIWPRDSSTGLVTKLETFKLPDPRSAGPFSIVKIGELELGKGERLHATRFDGNLVYVVTFFQIDPLWVVDLSDPTKPHIAGSVNVPGWSSYISPLGDRLITVGVESNRVAVSLFDVHDPANPAMLARQVLGQNYSWSDANYDEKAFTVLSEQGLVLVPYNGDTTNGWTSQVQLLDLSRTNLLARGIIHHQCQPRRTAFAQDRVLSLSGWELLSVDATDRDHPEVKGDAALAWSVDRVFVQGDYLLELSGSSGWWGYQTSPSIRVALLHQHDQVLSDLGLDNVPVVGSCVRDGRLYVAQSPSYSYWFYPPLPTGGPDGSTNDPPPTPPNFFVTILDISHLPLISILGQTSTTVDNPGWGSTWSAIWPKNDVLVWAGGASYYLWATPVNGGAAPGMGIVGGGFYPWWGGFGGGQLIAFDVHTPTAPSLDSYVNLSTNGWWGFSQPFSSSTRVYLSHAETLVVTNSTYTNGIWIQNNLLNVVDYADPLAPTLRTPVSIPGTLQGLSHEGELLYTTGTHFDLNNATDWTQWLDASAYDGVAAHLVASQALPDSWPHPVLVVDTNIFIGHPGYSSTTTNVTSHQLETWRLSDSGTFKVLGSVTLNQPANVLVERNGLLMTLETDGSLALFDDSGPKLQPLTTQQQSGCVWYDLNQADGGVTTGVWLPLGAYGVKEVDLAP